MIDEKFEVQAFRVAVAAAVETVLESVGSKEHCWQ
jgi:hypothetical protein